MKYPNEKPIFVGAATALITPLNESGPDLDAMGRLIDMQIAGGIDALVVCGTTGESATLSDSEKMKVLDYTVARTAGRVPVIAGTGTNDTEHAKKLTRMATEAGCDAMLVVTPYYNKATQAGLVAHFCQIADATDKPVMVYNVPSRTGVSIAPETYVKLAQHPNIKAIKEASGNISEIAKIAALVGDTLDIYSGNDDQIIPILSLGGKGVISVLSNLMPGETSRMCHDFLSGSMEEARKTQLRLLPLIDALFCQVNPIPIKAAMSRMGYCENLLRLPLTPMEGTEYENLLALMQQQGLI